MVRFQNCEIRKYSGRGQVNSAISALKLRGYNFFKVDKQDEQFRLFFALDVFRPDQVSENWFNDISKYNKGESK